MNLPLPPPPPAQPSRDMIGEGLKFLAITAIAGPLVLIGLVGVGAITGTHLDDSPSTNTNTRTQLCEEKRDRLRQTMLRRRYGNASLGQLKWNTAGMVSACD